MPLKIGHRGAPVQLPENTIGSFRKAVSLGVDGVELDVHLCKSGEPVIIHDDTVDRTTGGKGRVADLTLLELRELRIGGVAHIPTLAEVFEALGDIRYYVEIKAEAAALPSAELINNYIQKGWHAERVCLISFNHTALQAALAQFPALHIGASFDEMKDECVEKAQAMGAHEILPNYKTLAKWHVEAAHKAGMRVITWTVNEAKDIAAVRSMGVDGIISDYPERL